ncbi:MAG: sulfurtransferase [Clostridia bacterium]|nr:sulfurtransferase [Clostridia bacterium]
MIKKKAILVVLMLVCVLSLSACGGYDFEETGTEIILAETALDMMDDEEVVLVDAQKNSTYMKQHIQGAVNIERSDIVVSEPFPNMLAPKKDIEKILGKAGISNDSTVIIYDNNNNMDAARLWWTMKFYGHDSVKVISGGFNALIEKGADTAEGDETRSSAKYTINESNDQMIATLDDVMAQINNPKDNVKLLDVRSTEEFEEGTIPTSIHIDYITNNYEDGTYRNVQDIQIKYVEQDIKPEDTIIMYCKTSIRAAQTYLALYNAGYRDLKLYDGAWIEYSSDPSLPVQYPDGEAPVKPNIQDQS